MIFVYGTLLRGSLRAHCLAAANFLGLARVRGSLYDLGAYPGLSDDDAGTVIGEVYQVDAPTLAQLDRIEGFRPHDPEGSLYQRRVMDACLIASGETLITETYVYNQDLSGVARIPHGDYRRHLLEAEHESEPRWLLAYGSNLSSTRLAERVGWPQAVRAGYIAHAKLVFNKRASNGGVYANLAQGDRTDACPAVAYRLTADQIERLDRDEGVPTHYLRTAIPFQCRDAEETLLAEVYLADPAQLVEPDLPAEAYLRHLRHGYAEHGFEVGALPAVGA
jgi:gamma-glutamylcyclotransferase (GGCT)/AIG2-like uncharacterized protein YtfP